MLQAPQEGTRRGRRALQRGADRTRSRAAAGCRDSPRRRRASTIIRSPRSTRRGTSCRRRRRRPDSGQAGRLHLGRRRARTFSGSSRSIRCWSITSIARQPPRAKRTVRADAIVGGAEGSTGRSRRIPVAADAATSSRSRPTSTPGTARLPAARWSLNAVAQRAGREHRQAARVDAPRASSAYEARTRSHRRRPRRTPRDARRRPAGFMTLKREIEKRFYEVPRARQVRPVRSAGFYGVRRVTGVPQGLRGHRVPGSPGASRSQRRSAARSTRTSTSASRISSAARASDPGAARIATCRCSTARPTCSTSAAAAASFSISSPRAAFGARASI